MSFSFVGSDSAAPDGVTSVTINVPSGVRNGDFLILAAVSYTAGVWDVPSGWTAIWNKGLGANPTNHQFLLAWRVASSEPGAYTLTATAAVWPSVVMYAVRGGAASSPVLGSAVAVSSSYQTTLPPPSYTEQQASSLLVYGYGGVNSSGSGGGGLTLPSPGNLLPGSSTGDIGNSSGGTDLGVIACTSSTAPGSATITTAVDEADWVIEVAAPPPVTVAPFPQPGRPAKGTPAARRGGWQRAAGRYTTPPPVTVVNQWAVTAAAPAAPGYTPPVLQSTVLPLTPATSVAGGTGVPSAGNWLFCIAGWNQSGVPPADVTVNDDIHSFWRPGDENTSTWAVSPPAGNTRLAVWYTPNLARPPGGVYAAPSGITAGTAVLVAEVAGLGPWDTVTGVAAGYAGAATSLPLQLPAPAARAFVLAAGCGDNTAAGQATAPPGWNVLATVSGSNGHGHASDSVITAAWTVTAAAAAATVTAATATDLSGVIIAVLTAAPSPIPPGRNPAWPYLLFEAAPGGGFQTPPASLTWVDLTSRAWSWDETTGTQYQLGELQATNLNLELDNADGALSSDNPQSPWYPDLVTGTPLRIRAAIGTIGGTEVNRWYVIQRNMQEWPQQVDPVTLRRILPGTGTDIWSALSASCLTPYRGEIWQDSPYAWWPCDDQPGEAGILPVSLANAAPGNKNRLNILLSPSGAPLQYYFDTAGNSTIDEDGSLTGIAVYAAGTSQGWMYGDPQTQPATFTAAGNPVAATPGSAAWQASGQAGNTGSYGWFLSCNDTGFPSLSGGITVEGWFSCLFYGSGNGNSLSAYGPVNPVCQQPEGIPLTLLELASGSGPAAIVQLDVSGHLNLITYSGSTPTSHSIYSGSDLRSGAWFHVAVTLTETTWQAYVNGGFTAAAAGTAPAITPAWSWLIVNGDLGTAGGSQAGTGLARGGNMSAAHIAVYPAVLPSWRIAAHYWAAITAFGLLPAPSAVTIQWVHTGAASATSAEVLSDAYAPDGTGSYGHYGGSFQGAAASVIMAAAAGTVTSGPSAWQAQAVPGSQTPYTLWVSCTALAPSVLIYTSSAAGAEKEAAVICGTGDAFTKGYGAAAAGTGVSQTAAGTGASPPAAAVPTGDTPGQRIERILGYGHAPCPARCIDPGTLLIRAGTDIGGQQAAQDITNIAQSDGGLLFVDNQGNLTYWTRDRLASQYAAPAWTLTPAAPPQPGASPAAIPYGRHLRWTADPQRIWNAITIQPFAPDQAILPLITPSDAATAIASQDQYGPQPLQVVSYLQDTAKMQAQADWLLAEFGTLRVRAEDIKADAASYPAAWPLILGVNVGDIVSCQNWQVGGGGITGTFRVSGIKRMITFGGAGGTPEASVTLQLDFEPPAYWD